MASLSSVAEIILGQSPPSSTYNNRGDGLPFYQGKTDFGFKYPNPRLYCTEPKKTAEAGDILISVRAPVGPTNIAFEKSCIGRGLAAIRAKNIDPEFLSFNLKYIEPYVASLGTGSTFTAINKHQLADLDVNSSGFDISEQRRIAQVLNTVQTAIEQQARLIALTRELKSALMNKLFTEGLHGEKQKMTEIGPLPESWEEKPIDDVFEIKQGKQLSAKTKIGDNQKPFLRTSNVFWCRIDLSYLDFMNFTFEEEHKLTLKKGDLLVCEGGDIGRTAIWHGEPVECYFQNHLHRLRRKQDNVVPSFIQYWMMYAVVHRKLYVGHGNKTTIPNLSKAKLGQCLIPIPPTTDEQNSVANALETIERKITGIESRKSKLEELFRTLLHKLMTGQIRVHDIDYNEIDNHDEKERT